MAQTRNRRGEVGRAAGQLRLLLRHDVSRLRGALRHPSAAVWLGLGIPAVLVVGVLWGAGPAALPDVHDAEGAVLLGLLVSAPLAFLSYGVLFRGTDTPFLRRLGVSPRALYQERALRLLGLSGVLVLVVLLPFLSAGAPLRRALAVGAAAALLAWAGGAVALSLAALAMSRTGAGQGWGCLAYGMWDREVAAAAPLVYAPVAPLLAGALAAGFVGAAPGAAWLRVLAVAGVALVATAAAAGAFSRALPRFAPQLLEMAFATPPTADAGAFHTGRGVQRLLPRQAAAVWVRDGVVAGRRFAWATRITWPVAVVSVAALARWGGHPSTRAWVGAALFLALLAQGAAIVGLGRLERAGRRWIDRSAGISWPHRLLGRWAWGWGLSLWLTLPVSLAWSWWGGAGPGWPWLAAGAASAALATVTSLASAGWR